MEVIDFILAVQQVKPEALVNLKIESEKGRLLVKWHWIDETGNDRTLNRSILLKELNYDEAITAFLVRSKTELED